MVTLETRIKDMLGSNLCCDIRYLTEVPLGLLMYLQGNAGIISEDKTASPQTLPNSYTILPFDDT
jgi:hypothetical protein